MVIPKPRGAMSAAIRQGRDLPPLTLRREGAVLVVDGGLAQAGKGGLFDILDRSRCRMQPADLPVITVRAPINVRIVADGAVHGEVGPTESLDLTLSGCGAWKLAPVRFTLTVRKTGASTVDAASVNSVLGVRLIGSGDVVIRDGHAPIATVLIDGSGNVVDHGTVGRLAADLRGSGKVTVREIWGELDASVRGSGDVLYHRPKHFCGGLQTAC